MLLEALSKYPYEGLTRELLSLGMSWVVMYSDLNPDAEDIANALEGALNSLEDKIRLNISKKMSKNDKQSFDKVIKAWFNQSAPETYGELFELVIRETIELLKQGQIDLVRSLSKVRIDKGGIYLGVEYKRETAILPAILKQPEYYEYQSGFLVPTTGQKAQIRLDPLWFSLIAVGFLISFAGLIRGKYYLITKPGIETFWPYEIEDIIEKGLIPLTEAGISGKIGLSTEELYEMKLAMRLAETNTFVPPEVYPVVLHLISLEGRAYAELKTLQLDLSELTGYLQRYVENIERLKISGLQVMVEIKEKGTMVYKYPLWALVDLAEEEISNEVSGDNEMLAYIFVKDLYKAVNSGNKKLIEDAVFRLFRQGRALLEGSARVSRELKRVLKAFMWKEHMGVLV
ncbi:MAG: type I-A CRISPR-associated protein Cas8a2/Csx9 [Thermoproteota archaeon]|nr:MAG: type I-A CRISPR-associated protein Cas8a2/Csx9 [Candidatus Korarchaeota archaeon]RLG49642.1 MAG: type I-A CRISPR-associated protein Cas8a2/Csx9 [Candidatus Korarchaeota archaeon]